MYGNASSLRANIEHAKQLLKSGKTQKEVARIYKVSKTTVNNVLKEPKEDLTKDVRSFVQEKIKVLEAKLANTPEFKELNVLTNLMRQLLPEPVVNKPEVLQKLELATKKKRNVDHSPFRNVPTGNRLEHFISLLEKYVEKTVGTTIDIETLNKVFRNLEGINFKKFPTGNIASYIRSFNRCNPDKIKFALISEHGVHPCGKSKRYTHVRRIAA